MTNELDVEDLGPAMRRCSVKERAFVVALLEQGNLNYGLAAAAAGYRGTEHALAVQGSRIIRRERVQAAVIEEAKTRLGGAAITAVSSLARAAADPTSKDHVKASLAIMNRVGLHEVRETVVHHRHEMSYGELMTELRQLSSRLGVALPPWAEPPVDAQFEEVTPGVARLSPPATIQTGAEGLEDIL